MAVSKPFADILSARRDAFNSIAQTASAGASNFDTEDFSNFLETEVDVIVRAVCSVEPDRAARAAEHLFEMAVNLVAQRRAGPGARGDLVNQVWRDVAPRLPHLIAIDAVESLGALTNSAVYVSAQRGVRIGEWVKTITGLAPDLSSIESLRQLITVVTWRSGGAHIRSAALEAARTLPPQVAQVAMGLPQKGNVDKAIAALQADIWWAPGGVTETMGHSVGGFTGLGGPFSTPPEVRAIEDGFLARCAEDYFHISVDSFGAIIRSAKAENWDETDRAGKANPAKNIDMSALALGMPEAGTNICRNDDTAAIFSPHSHLIRVLPRAAIA